MNWQPKPSWGGYRSSRIAYQVMNQEPKMLAHALELVDAYEHNFKATVGREHEQSAKSRARQVTWAAEDALEVSRVATPIWATQEDLQNMQARQQEDWKQWREDLARELRALKDDLMVQQPSRSGSKGSPGPQTSRSPRELLPDPPADTRALEWNQITATSAVRGDILGGIVPALPVPHSRIRKLDMVGDGDDCPPTFQKSHMLQRGPPWQGSCGRLLHQVSGAESKQGRSPPGTRPCGGDSTDDRGPSTKGGSGSVLTSPYGGDSTDDRGPNPMTLEDESAPGLQGGAPRFKGWPDIGSVDGPERDGSGGCSRHRSRGNHHVRAVLPKDVRTGEAAPGKQCSYTQCGGWHQYGGSPGWGLGLAGRLRGKMASVSGSHSRRSVTGARPAAGGRCATSCKRQHLCAGWEGQEQTGLSRGQPPNQPCVPEEGSHPAAKH